MRRLCYLLFFVSHLAWAELPLSFASAASVTNMAIGQTQILNYIIQNNTNITLPLQRISVANDGDQQPSSATSFQSACGSSLAAKASCSITVTISNLHAGKINRHLNIEYGGRAPLISPIVLNAAQAKYTILEYIVGSNLEKDDNVATKNIEQMKAIGSNDTINIVIETGGSLKPGWTTVKRKLVLPGTEYLIKDLGSVNMGLESTIQDFFEWGVRQFPADNYIAIYWDHGGGPNGGFGGDQVHGGADTSIKEISAAMKAVTQNTGKNFEIIGFDTCLLGNIEIVSGLYPYTHYVVGSEDLEPGAGWQYNTFLDFVTKNPTTNGLAIGKVIADGFTEQNKGDSTTLSVISAQAIPDVLSALNQFTATLSPYLNNIANWKQLARGRLRAPDYSTSVWDNQSRDLADLTGVANGMMAAFPGDSSLQNAGTTLINAVQNAVKYRKNSENRAASYGLTIYFPSILKEYATGYPNTTVLNGQSFFSSDYTDFITSYHTFYTTNRLSLVAIPTNLSFDGTSYTATVTNGFEEAYAAAGNDACSNITGLPGVPCYSALQSSGINSAPLGGDQWNINYNKATNIAKWPLLNNLPVLLITLDTEPVIDNELSFLIPVITQSDSTVGFLEVIKDANNNYEVAGFQADTGINKPDTKTVEIPPGTKFFLRTYAEETPNVWKLHTTTSEVTAPFTLTFGSLFTDFNKFRFLVADLTGELHITSSSEAY